MERMVTGLCGIALLGACTAATPPSPAPVPAPTACNAAPAQNLIGKTASSATGADLLHLTGARTLRWVAPGTAVTMDFRPDRLTVVYDEKMIITRIGCG